MYSLVNYGLFVLKVGNRESLTDNPSVKHKLQNLEDRGKRWYCFSQNEVKFIQTGAQITADTHALQANCCQASRWAGRATLSAPNGPGSQREKWGGLRPAASPTGAKEGTAWDLAPIQPPSCPATPADLLPEGFSSPRLQVTCSL